MVQSLSRALQPDGAVPWVVETPHAWLFLCSNAAYKLPKSMGEDGSAGGPLESGRLYCEEDVRLNQRLEVGCHLGVQPIRGTPDRPSLGGSGMPIAYAVAMRRVPSATLGSLRLAHGALTHDDVARLAEFVEHFHAQAPTARPGMGPGLGSADAVLAETQQLGTALASPPSLQDGHRFDHWLRAETSRLAPRFAARLAAGHVRDIHGDMRLDHVAVRDGQVQVFTGVEHEPARRWIDVFGDVAGIFVDLLAHGRRDLAFVFLNRYLEQSGDYGGLDVLRFHLVKRALQRALILAMSPPLLNDTDALASGDYIAVAQRLLHAADPRLLVTHGATRQERRFTAMLLVQRAGAIRVSASVEEQRLFGHAPWAGDSTTGGAAGSSASMGMLTHERLRRAAAASLAAGFPTLVDAGCRFRWQRDGLHAIAAAMGVPFNILDYGPHVTLRDDAPLQTRAAAWAEPGDTDDEPLGELERRLSFDAAASASLSLAALAARWLAAPPSVFRH